VTSRPRGPVAGDVRWGVVVPVKRLAVAKTRLGAYGDALRQSLALAFAADVVLAARTCPAVAAVLVVTDDERARAALSAPHVRIVPDDPDAGLNPALDHGADLLRLSEGTLAVATVSSDLPSLRAPDLEVALRAVPAGGRGFVADAAGTGTTLLAADAGAHLAPSYGPGSAERHARSGAVLLAGTAALRRDVDTPADLRAAARLGVGPHTRALLAELGCAQPASTPPPSS
jgi:2-phospho-L-lactate guanylyltransferase